MSLSPDLVARPPAPPILARARHFWQLTKPRVTWLALFCAVIGMLLAVDDGLPPLGLVLKATAGIWLLAGAAFAFNSILERTLDAKMARTHLRPVAHGDLAVRPALLFAGLIGSAGAWILYVLVNPLTMWLTLATFLGYAVVYTLLLKPNTPQNIVIGGLSGAMPPVLGWAAATGTAPAPAWLLALIIFVWTPPHFWSLALYRVEDFRRSGLPMLPVTHGSKFTRLHILLYTLVLVATTLLPFATGQSGWIYLGTAVVLGAFFSGYALRLYRAYSDALARATFRYSIVYLAALFAGLLADKYLGR